MNVERLKHLRRRNLRQLRNEYAGTKKSFADLLGEDDSWIAQLCTEHNPKPISEDTARKFEKRLGLRDGFLDRDEAFGSRGGRARGTRILEITEMLASASDDQLSEIEALLCLDLL